MISTLKKLLLVGISVLEVLGARTVEELKVAYEVRMLAVGKEHQESLEKLAAGYSGALDEVQKKLQSGGRLDDVLKVVEEKKSLNEQKWPLGRLNPSAPADLLRLRKIYEDSRIEADRNHAKAVIETSDRMVELLQREIVELTRAGKIDEAKQAQTQLELIEKDPGVDQSRRLLARVRRNESAPVAMQIRRSGDQLEVLVRYDRSGKISLDSPVENVIEITGGRKEKGETRAKVLGEFVGAKGYEVDSFISYQSEMDKIAPPMNAVSFEVEAGFEFQGRRALRVRMPEKATNPRVEWFQILASESESSRIKIDFWYFIPKENQKLQAFYFHYGIAAPIERKVMETRGRWISETLETESLNKWNTLRFYVRNLSGSDKTFNGGNESIYLDDLKVTFLSFAAHLVAKYEDGKVIGPENDDPETQKAIVLAGKLLPSSTD